MRALGIVLYHVGLSLRDTFPGLGGLKAASHEAAGEWHHRIRDAFFTLSISNRTMIRRQEALVASLIDDLWVR